MFCRVEINVARLGVGSLGGEKVPRVVDTKGHHGKAEASHSSLPCLSSSRRKTLARLDSEGHVGCKVGTSSCENRGLEDLAVGALAGLEISRLGRVEDLEDVGVVGHCGVVC